MTEDDVVSALPGEEKKIYRCPECGYEANQPGNCPECRVPLEAEDEKEGLGVDGDGFEEDKPLV